MIGAHSSIRSSDESAQFAMPSQISPAPMEPPLEQVKLLARISRARRRQTSTLNMIAQEIERMRYSRPTFICDFGGIEIFRGADCCFCCCNKELAIKVVPNKKYRFKCFTWACIICWLLICDNEFVSNSICSAIRADERLAALIANAKQFSAPLESLIL